jgi:hypothetical protein
MPTNLAIENPGRSRERCLTAGDSSEPTDHILVDRSMRNAQVSAKHFDRYPDEFEVLSFLFRDALLRLLRAEALPYQRLTA